MLRKNTSQPLSSEPPPGVLSCVWMSAGLVAFKLCDREGECDGCPFDVAMRSPPSQPRRRRRTAPKAAGTA